MFSRLFGQACGTLLVGPVMHHWYGFLAVKFPPSLGAARMTFSKMAVDQCFMAPTFVPLFT